MLLVDTKAMGKALKEARESAGLTLSEAAESLKSIEELRRMVPNTIRNYEQGIVQPDLKRVANLCRIYHGSGYFAGLVHVMNASLKETR